MRPQSSVRVICLSLETPNVRRLDEVMGWIAGPGHLLPFCITLTTRNELGLSDVENT